MLLALFACVAVSSCRKAEDDPLISLRTRKARVCGDWKITSGQGSTTNVSWTGSTGGTSWAYDGSMITETDGFGNKTLIPYSCEYSFKKDGTFAMTEVINGNSYHLEGQWNFNEGKGEPKAKTEIVLFTTLSSSGSNVNTYSGYFPTVMYKILELRNNKMVLGFHDNITYYWGDKVTSSETWVFEPK